MRPVLTAPTSSSSVKVSATTDHLPSSPVGRGVGQTATVPRGEYTVEAYLFRDGTVTSAQSTPLYVDQQGLERRLFTFAHTSPFTYGLSAVVMAMFLGWLSSLLIRQPR